MVDVMVSTANLTKVYGQLKALDDVSITIKRGAIVGLVGQNGAGKTTLIRILTGLVTPTSGSFELLPNDVRLDTTVAAIVERPSIYANMNAMDNLIAQCKLLGIAIDTNYLKETLRLVGLHPTSQLTRNYSLGMKQRLAIAMTLVGKPQLLILDEPTNGLDPQGIYDMREVFVNLNREMGVTIIVSSHILSELAKFATEYYVMDKGKVIKHLTAQELDALGDKRLRMSVDNAERACEALAQYGKVEILHDGRIELIADTPPTQVLLTLAQAGVAANSITQVGDTLEDYYVRLLKEGDSRNLTAMTKEARHD